MTDLSPLSALLQLRSLDLSKCGAASAMWQLSGYTALRVTLMVDTVTTHVCITADGVLHMP